MFLNKINNYTKKWTNKIAASSYLFNSFLIKFFVANLKRSLITKFIMSLFKKKSILLLFHHVSFFLNLRISHYILHKIIFPSAYNFFNYDPYRIYSPFPIDGIKASINNGQTSFIKKQILFYIENDNFIYVRKIVVLIFF